MGSSRTYRIQYTSKGEDGPLLREEDGRFRIEQTRLKRPGAGIGRHGRVQGKRARRSSRSCFTSRPGKGRQISCRSERNRRGVELQRREHEAPARRSSRVPPEAHEVMASEEVLPRVQGVAPQRPSLLVRALRRGRREGGSLQAVVRGRKPEAAVPLQGRHPRRRVEAVVRERRLVEPQVLQGRRTPRRGQVLEREGRAQEPRLLQERQARRRVSRLEEELAAHVARLLQERRKTR